MPQVSCLGRKVASGAQSAASAEDTDWRQIAALYDQLFALTPTPVVALNRAVAVAERDGAAAGLAALEAVDGLASYHAYQAARADLLRRVGREAEAADAYRIAVELSANPAERAYLEERLAGLEE